MSDFTKKSNDEIFSDFGVNQTDEVVVSTEALENNQLQSTSLVGEQQNNTNENVELFQNIEELNVDDNAFIPTANVESQKARAFAGGVTFQFADELEAFAVSLLDSGKTYAEAKAEINKKVADYQKAHPKEAFGMELAGAFLPTLLSVFGGPGAWSASVSNIFRLGRTVFQSGSTSGTRSVANMMNRSGVGAGFYSLGASDDKSFGDFATGYLIGAPIAGGFILGGNVLTGIATYVSTLAKARGGNVMEKAVRKELNKLMQQTGKTEDEVIVDLMNGRLMSENQTMINLIKETIKGKGEAPDILKRIHQGNKGAQGDVITVSRPAQTKDDLISAMQSSATGTKSDKNLTKIWTASQEKIKLKEKELYDTVFKKKNGNPNLVKGQADNVVNDLIAAAKTKGSGVFEELNAIYSASGGKQLFKRNKNGTIKILRQPTLEDAEIIRRTLDELAYNLYKDGKGTRAGHIQKMADDIRKKLDKFSPKLAKVREKASVVRKGREAYEYGLGLLTSKKGNSAEDVEVFIDKFGDVPGVLNALRIGVTQALKNKGGYTKIKEMANADMPLYDIIAKIVPKKELAEIQRLADVAANSAKTAPQMTADFGSQTAEKFQMSNIASNSGGEGTRINIGAIVNMAYQYFKKNRGLSDAQAKKYVEVITTSPKNAQDLQKALIDDSSMGTFMKLLDSMIVGGSQLVGDLAAKRGGTNVNERIDPVGSSGIPGLMQYAAREYLGVGEQK
jgi:hypothetical protein